MLLSKTEIAGWIIAIMVVVTMGVLVFSGPFHHINKVHAAAGPMLHVKIVSDARTIGRYTPAAIKVKVGQPITWTNSSNTDHTVTARNASFDSHNIAQGASYVFTPTRPGKYAYVCLYHPLMLGTIIVTK